MSVVAAAAASDVAGGVCADANAGDGDGTPVGAAFAAAVGVCCLCLPFCKITLRYVYPIT